MRLWKALHIKLGVRSMNLRDLQVLMLGLWMLMVFLLILIWLGNYFLRMKASVFDYVWNQSFVCDFILVDSFGMKQNIQLCLRWRRLLMAFMVLWLRSKMISRYRFNYIFVFVFYRRFCMKVPLWRSWCRFYVSMLCNSHLFELIVFTLSDAFLCPMFLYAFKDV